MTEYFIQGDCLEEMSKMDEKSIDIIVTSPPYNLNIKYNKYKDNLTIDAYLLWMNDISESFRRILKDDGSVFLNIGYTSQNPWIAMDVAQVFRKHFILQNNITWVKHIKINKDTYGIYKPINSHRYTTPTNESIFHFTKTGKISVDRLSIVGEYNPRSGKYASAYTETASANRHETDLKRRAAKKLFGHKNWKDVCEISEFKKLFKQMQEDNPFIWNSPKDEGNTWYIPYVPIAKLAKELGETKKGTKETGKGEHPATFPVHLPEQCIKFAGIKGNMVVLDPFLGTGTTLVACKKLGVNGIGIELDKKYLDFSKNRVNLYTKDTE